MVREEIRSRMTMLTLKIDKGAFFDLTVFLRVSLREIFISVRRLWPLVLGPHYSAVYYSRRLFVKFAESNPYSVRIFLHVALSAPNYIINSPEGQWVCRSRERYPVKFSTAAGSWSGRISAIFFSIVVGSSFKMFRSGRFLSPTYSGLNSIKY